MRTRRDKANTISSILKGEFIAEQNNTKLIPFLLLIVILGLINIRSSFHAEKLLKETISNANASSSESCWFNLITLACGASNHRCSV